MSNGWSLHLQMVGVNHRQATVEIRERLCCPIGNTLANGDGETYEGVVRDLFPLGQETRD
jgi:hypothetical protein